MSNPYYGGVPKTSRERNEMIIIDHACWLDQVRRQRTHKVDYPCGIYFLSPAVCFWDDENPGPMEDW